MTDATILIVQDDQSATDNLEERLIALGYTVCAAVSSEPEAMEKAAAMNPDLALIDLELEGEVNGVEVAEQLGTQMPVIYLMDEVEEDLLQRAEATQPFGYVIESVDARQLHLNIQTALSLYKRERKHRETEREKDQKIDELQHQAQRMETILDSISDGVIAADENGDYLTFNSSAKQIVGTYIPDTDLNQRSEEYGLFLPDRVTLFPSDDLPLARAIRGESSDDVEVFVRNPNLSEGTYISISGRPLQTDKSGVRGGVIVFRDISKDKEAEAQLEQAVGELRDQTHLMETVFENINNGVVLSDATNRILYLNASARRILGTDINTVDISVNERSETYGIFYPDGKTYVPTDHLPLVRAVKGEKTEEMGLFFRNEKNPDGTYVRIRGVPVLDSDGTTVKAGMAILRDFTEHKSLEDRLLQLTGEPHDQRPSIESVPDNNGNGTKADVSDVTENKEMQDRSEQTIEYLREQLQLMEAICDNLNDGIIVASPEGQILFANKTTEKIFGTWVVDPAPSDWSRTFGVYYPDIKTLVPVEQLPLTRALYGEETVDMEVFIRNQKNPEGTYISARGRPILNSDETEVVAGLAILRDITEKKEADARLEQAADELRDQTQLLETVLDSMSDGIIVTDENRKVLVFNRSAEQIGGVKMPRYHTDEWVKEHGFFLPNQKTPLSAEFSPIQHAINGEATDNIEIFIRNEQKPDGVHTLVSGRPIRGKGGISRGAVVVVRDITRIRQAEARLEQTADELHEQTQLLETVFENMGEGLIVADTKGNLLLYNSRAKEIFGTANLNVDPDKWSETYGIFSPDQKTYAQFDQYPLIRALHGEVAEDIEFFVRNESNPEGIYISASARPLMSKDNSEVVASVGIVRNITKRKTAEAKLEQTARELQNQNELMETVFDSISDGVIAVNAEGKFTIYNPSAEQIYGIGSLDLPPEQWTDRYGVFLSDQKTPAPIDQLPLVRALRGQNTDGLELFIRNEERPEGVHISVNGRPLEQDIYGHGGGVVVFRDITERKKAETELQQTMRELRNQNELVETSFNSISDGIVVADEKGNFLYVNASAEEIVGMGATDTPQEEWAEKYGSFYPDQKTPMPTEELPLLRAIFGGESTDDVEVFIRNEKRPDGVYILVSGRPLRNAVGGIRGGMIVFRDITERKKAEAKLEQTARELRNQNELMKTAFNSISDGLAITNLSDRSLYINPSAVQITGIDGINTPLLEWSKKQGIFYPDQKTLMKIRDLPFPRILFRGESINDEDIFIRNEKKPDGVYIRLSGRPLRNEHGAIRGAVITFRDVTEQMINEEALRQAFAQGRLEVVDTILHNIGNAINSVTIGIDTLHQSLSDDLISRRFSALANAVEARREDWVDYIQNDPQGQQVLPFVIALAEDLSHQNEKLVNTVARVNERTKHIADIIRTQKSLSGLHVVRKDIDLRNAIYSAVKVLQDSLNNRGIEITVNCENAPREIRIQESQFHQMMINLIKNSMEAIDESIAKDGLRETPRIQVHAYMKRNFLNIDVNDNGIGISKENAKKIFSAGYTTKKEGSGLGLHSAANFVISSGGQIHPLSDGIGCGTTMRIMLRLASIIPPRENSGGGGGGAFDIGTNATWEQ